MTGQRNGNKKSRLAGILLIPAAFLLCLSFPVFARPSSSPRPSPEGGKEEPIARLEEIASPALSGQNAPESGSDDPAFFGTAEKKALFQAPEAPFVSSPRPVPPPDTQPDPPSVTDPVVPVTPNPPVLPPDSGVPQSEARDESYFADALFVGDSRTVGLSLYSGISSTYYADTGLNVLTALSKPFVKIDGTSCTILDAVALHPDFKKVYISFGINEIGWPSVTTFIGTYETLLTGLEDLLGKDTVFYIQGIIPVSQAIDDSGYIKNERIVSYNALLCEMAEKHGAHFIDLTGLYAPSGGVLPAEISSDGIHLNRSGVIAYMDWLLTHTVS